FRREFNTLYPEIRGSTFADFWNERLNYEGDEFNWAMGRELLFVIIAALFAGTISKLPAILNIDNEFFYTRNAGFIIFPVLCAYFAWKNKMTAVKIACVSALTVIGLLFINLLPGNYKTDTLDLSCLHMPLFLWSLSGFAFVNGANNNTQKRLAYLSYNGDLVVITTLIIIAAGILSGATIGLFSLIGINIEKFYFQNVVLFGLPAAPIAGTWLTQTNPQLVGKVSPVIARIFSPLVLGMLIVYLIAIIYSGKSPYTNRDFLLVFNALLAGVMALIFFSVAESARSNKHKAEIWILTLLSIVTIVVNGVALSAILFRISEWGITPNRAAILGGNILILANLLLVTVQLIRTLAKKRDITSVGNVITRYLPVYLAWAAIVTFVFPFLFGFR
ncbi:MAG TPA: hypothetical protein VM187_19530, partial [Niastella sp.]|nr:hypothetical protein [Niastella sp.]